MSLLVNFLLDLNNIVCILLFILTTILVRELFNGRKSRQFPPGPRGWPFVGSLFLLLRGDKRETFRKLRQRYGDLVYLTVGSQPILIVNGVEMIHEVFINHGKDFEFRPPVFSVTKVGQGKAVLNNSGPAWKEHRQILLEHMNDLGIGKTKFEKNVLVEIQQVLQILESTQGQDFNPNYCTLFAMSNIICSISYGKRFDYDDKQFKDMLNIFYINMRIGLNILVNYFPFLEYFPGDPCKCGYVLDNVAKIQKILSTWIEHHKATIDPRKPRDFIDFYLLGMKKKVESKKKTTMDDSQLLKLVGELFVAGIETISTSAIWALIFLLRNPDVQREMYEEIKNTLGSRTRLSVLDKPLMPYTHAVLLECQRLGDIAPFAFPHSNIRDVQLAEYTVPANCIVLPNLNSVHMDPELWEDPLEFRPSRFLGEDGQLVQRKGFMPFFLGSRMCPGASLAKMELFHYITSIVQHFEIQQAETEGLPSLTGHIGITYSADPCKMRFIRRSQNNITPIHCNGSE